MSNKLVCKVNLVRECKPRGKMTCKRVMMVLCVVVALLAAVASTATTVEDEKECADQLTNLASCIPFVSGTAKKPTPECCKDTEKLKASKPKCLCLTLSWVFLSIPLWPFKCIRLVTSMPKFPTAQVCSYSNFASRE